MANPLPTIDLTYPEDMYGEERIEDIYGKATALGEEALPGGGYSVTGSPLWTAMFGTPGTGGAPGSIEGAMGAGMPGYLGRMGKYAEQAPWLRDAMNQIAGQYGGMMTQTRGDIERQMGTYQEGAGGAQARAQQLAQAQLARERSTAQLDYAQRAHRERMYGMGMVGQQYLAGMGLGAVPAGQAYSGMQNVYAGAPGMMTPWQKMMLQAGMGSGGAGGGAGVGLNIGGGQPLGLGGGAAPQPAPPVGGGAGGGVFDPEAGGPGVYTGADPGYDWLDEAEKNRKKMMAGTYDTSGTYPSGVGGGGYTYG